MTSQTYTARTANIAARVEQSTWNGGTYWRVISVNPRTGYERSLGSWAEADCHAVAQKLVDDAQRQEDLDAEANATLDYIDARCDQCGTRLPASRRCQSCEL